MGSYVNTISSTNETSPTAIPRSNQWFYYTSIYSTKLRTQAELKSQRDAAAIINRNIRTVAPQAELKAQRDAAAIINKNLRTVAPKAKFKAQRDAAAIINRNIRTVAPKAKFKAQRDAEAQIDNLANELPTRWEFNTTDESKNFRKWLVAFNQVLVSSRSMLTGKQWVELLDKKKEQYTGSLVGRKRWANCVGHSWFRRRTKSEKSYNRGKDNIERSFPEDGVNL